MKNITESLWLEFVKHKWPNLVVGSEEYNARRKAFYVGAFTVLGLFQKMNDSGISHIIQEISAEVKRGESEITKRFKL